MLLQPKRVKFTNCSHFLSHISWLKFSFLSYFLLVGIGQLDNNVYLYLYLYSAGPVTALSAPERDSVYMFQNISL